MKISKKTIAELSDEYSKIVNVHEFLNELGSIIRAELVGLRLIGEIERPEGKDTYDALRNALKRFCRIKKMGDFDPAYFDFPDRREVMSLYFVWAGVFNYGADGGHDFWPHVLNELGFRHISAKSPECGKLFDLCGLYEPVARAKNGHGDHFYSCYITNHWKIILKYVFMC